MFTVQALFAPLRPLLNLGRNHRSNALDEVNPPPVNSSNMENFGDAVKPPLATNKDLKNENTLDKRERAIREKLARLARVSAESIFEFVVFS
jgi:hypothetical protein